jgi:hypothetical protein
MESNNNKNLLTQFVQEDRFELNSYLTYMFNAVDQQVPGEMENQMVNQ